MYLKCRHLMIALDDRYGSGFHWNACLSIAEQASIAVITRAKVTDYIWNDMETARWMDVPADKWETKEDWCQTLTALAGRVYAADTMQQQIQLDIIIPPHRNMHSLISAIALGADMAESAVNCIRFSIHLVWLAAQKSQQAADEIAMWNELASDIIEHEKRTSAQQDIADEIRCRCNNALQALQNETNNPSSMQIDAIHEKTAVEIWSAQKQYDAKNALRPQWNRLSLLLTGSNTVTRTDITPQIILATIDPDKAFDCLVFAVREPAFVIDDLLKIREHVCARHILNWREMSAGEKNVEYLSLAKSAYIKDDASDIYPDAADLLLCDTLLEAHDGNGLIRDFFAENPLFNGPQQFELLQRDPDEVLSQKFWVQWGNQWIEELENRIVCESELRALEMLFAEKGAWISWLEAEIADFPLPFTERVDFYFSEGVSFFHRLEEAKALLERGFSSFARAYQYGKLKTMRARTPELQKVIHMLIQAQDIVLCDSLLSKQQYECIAQLAPDSTDALARSLITYNSDTVRARESRPRSLDIDAYQQWIDTMMHGARALCAHVDETSFFCEIRSNTNELLQEINQSIPIQYAPKTMLNQSVSTEYILDCRLASPANEDMRICYTPQALLMSITSYHMRLKDYKAKEVFTKSVKVVENNERTGDASKQTTAQKALPSGQKTIRVSKKNDMHVLYWDWHTENQYDKATVTITQSNGTMFSNTITKGVFDNNQGLLINPLPLGTKLHVHIATMSNEKETIHIEQLCKLPPVMAAVTFIPHLTKRKLIRLRRNRDLGIQQIEVSITGTDITQYHLDHLRIVKHTPLVDIYYKPEFIPDSKGNWSTILLLGPYDSVSQLELVVSEKCDDDIQLIHQ